LKQASKPTDAAYRARLRADVTVMKHDTDVMSDPPAQESALRYDGAEEPRISVWSVLLGIALLVALAHYAHKLVRF
jgi:hypothetical protein